MTAALAFEAFQHRRFFAADVGAGAHSYEEVEAILRSLDIVAEPVGLARDLDRLAQHFDRVGIFRPNVDVALRGTARDGCDGHAFDEAEWIAFHQHAVGVGAAVAFVGVAGDVLFSGREIVNRLPLDAGREAGAAASAQARCRDFGDDVDRLHLQGFR